LTLFEFLTVAVSIVLGLGLVRLMDGLGGVLRSPSRYWIHLAVLLGLIACHLFYWWSLWSFHEYPDWNFFRFTYVIFGALLLYLAASALVPRDMDSVRSWKEHYFRVHRSLYLAIACYVVQQVLAPAVMRGSFGLPSAYSVLGMVLVLAAAFTDSERFHGFLMVLFWLLLTVVLLAFGGTF